jgi:hypothetical protein
MKTVVRRPVHAQPMKTGVLAVLAAAAVVAVAALLSSPDDSRRDVAVLEIGGSDDGRVELVPVDAGAAGPRAWRSTAPAAARTRACRTGASSGGSPASGGGKSTRRPARPNCTYVLPVVLL